MRRSRDVRPYNPPVRALLLNRILIVLGFAGLFIAGVLSVSHFYGLVPPCGSSKGCETVTTHPTAYWFAGTGGAKGIPVAYFGLLGYLLLTALAVVRGVAGLDRTRPTVMLGYVIAAIGAATSIYLQYISYTAIHAWCLFCVASAITMVLTLIVYALLAQAMQETDAGGRSKLDLPLSAALVLALAVGLGVQTFYMRGGNTPAKVVSVPQDVPLIPEGANSYGNADAPITIVEFADIVCGACRATAPKVKEFVERHPGKVRLVYRHFPLMNAPGHQMALVAALASEYAAEKGKFWEYLAAIMARPEGKPPSEMTMEDIEAAARSVGLDPAELKRRIQDKEDPVYDRISRDLNATDRLGIQMTPTFFILAPGQPVRSATAQQLFGVLEGEEYQAHLGGNSSG